MTELYIDGHRIELGDVKIPQVYQINDIGEAKDRQSNYTYPFDISETAHNLRVLGMLGIANTNKPYVKLRGKLIENSIEIIPDGIVSVFSKSKGKFKASIRGGNEYLFDKIGNKKLSDLDLSEYNHKVNEETFIDSFTNDSGYIYAVSDYGKTNSVTGVELRYQMPSLFVRTVWDKIFSGANINYQGDIFQSEKFKELLLTPYRGYDNNLDEINVPVDVFSEKGSGGNVGVLDRGAGNSSLNPILNISAQKHILIGEVLFSDTVLKCNSVFLCPSTGIYTISAELYSHYGGVSFSIGIFSKNSDGKYLTTSVSKHLKLTGGNTLNVNETALLKKDDIVAFYLDGSSVKFDNGINHGGSSKSVKHVQYKNFRLRNKPSITNFEFKNYLGDLKQIDFVKDIMQHFGLLMQKKRNELTYSFITIKKLISDRSNTLDWSGKFIEETKQNYKLSKYAQSNTFAYNYLENSSEEFANGTLKIDNENLPIEKSLVKRPYNAPVPSEKKLGMFNFLYTPFWKAERDDTGKITKYTPFKSKNYLCKLVKAVEFMKYRITDDFPVKTYTRDVPILDFTGLDYQTILNENYQELKKVLDYNFVLNAKMLLNEIDIQNLDLFRTIFLEQYGADFYVNKIKYINSSMLSEVELVKIKRG